MWERIYKLGYDYEDPKKPGPRYYAGCFKNKKAEKKFEKEIEKKQKLVVIEDEEESILSLEDQSTLKDEGSSTIGISIILIFLCCVSSCIGCCVYVCKKRG